MPRNWSLYRPVLQQKEVELFLLFLLLLFYVLLSKFYTKQTQDEHAVENLIALIGYSTEICGHCQYFVRHVSAQTTNSVSLAEAEMDSVVRQCLRLLGPNLVLSLPRTLSIQYLSNDSIQYLSCHIFYYGNLDLVGELLAF